MKWVRDKRIWIVCQVIFFLVVSAHLWALGMEDGNTLLKQKKYKEASAAYEQLISEGYRSHELFYNLGISYLHENNRYKAILNFERALRIKPMDEETRKRILEVNLGLSDKPPIYEDAGFLAFLKRVQFSLSVDVWAILSILSMFLVAASIFVVYRFGRIKARQLIFMSSFLWLLISIVSVIMARNSYHYRYLSNEAVVSRESIRVYDKSDVNSSILFNLHQGTKVEINGEENGMYHVQFVERSGWISTKDAEKISL